MGKAAITYIKPVTYFFSLHVIPSSWPDSGKDLNKETHECKTKTTTDFYEQQMYKFNHSLHVFFSPISTFLLYDKFGLSVHTALLSQSLLPTYCLHLKHHSLPTIDSQCKYSLGLQSSSLDLAVFSLKCSDCGFFFFF